MADKNEKEVNYKETLNLPRTDFSMKANLPQREPEMLKKWANTGIYPKILEKRKDSGKTFILHDGPPYANGHIHVGHVLNKILKDICVKYYAMKGYYSPYVPGWDCHGLPVEHQLFKELNIDKTQISQVEFRKKAYNYAMKFVKIQAEEFRRLGVFGDWENPYLTLTNDYESDILMALADLYEKGYIYKGLKPVNWCKSCETALAEAEVEYEDKTSASIYVKFPSAEKYKGKDTFFIIWTTTPWTLLANVAVALHPDFRYSFIGMGGEIWIMASSLVEPTMKRFGISGYDIAGEMTGKEIAAKFAKAVHPFIKRDSVLVLADYVTKEEGTGCVHTAPGHGQDDYVTGKKYNLPVIMPVNDKGVFTADAGEFAGQDVFKANKAIIDKMKKDGTLLLSEEVRHSYPHCWRCKNPIIFRATEQWFMNIDHDGLRQRMAKAIKEDVKWIPSAGAERIGSMVELRPDWCLSRQRYWGVPIPAFQCEKCGTSFTSADIIKKVAHLVREKGANVWFEKDIKEMLPQGACCAKCGGKSFKKEDNILDVWFDSGVSYKPVLEGRKELRYPADLYLEGSDQHRGWFQAALITSMAIKGNAPYKKVLTHGFVVDGEGKKMSKSVGNVIAPQEVMRDYGADILRLWVASSDYEGDIKLSPEILARLADGYRKIRNTLKYLLSNLYDFDPAKDALDHASLSETDKWILSRLYRLVTDITGYYDSWEFYKVYRAVYDFCVYEVSAFYLDVMKDVLYITLSDSSERRSAQTAIFHILSVLTRVMAPILAFTSDEAWAHIISGEKEESVHLALWPSLDKGIGSWENRELDSKWGRILDMRDRVMKILEEKREKALIGSSLEARLVMHSDDAAMKSFLEANSGILAFLFRVSRVDIALGAEDGMESTPGFPLKIGVHKAFGRKCPRCWNYSESVGKNAERKELCDRCFDVISKTGKRQGSC